MAKTKKESGKPIDDKATLKIKIKIAGTVIGPGKIAILQAVDQGGGISKAARSMGMTYRRAWHLINTLNTSFNNPVVETTVGGEGGGGAYLTEFGKNLVMRYLEALDASAQSATGLLDWLGSNARSGG